MNLSTMKQNHLSAPSICSYTICSALPFFHYIIRIDKNSHPYVQIFETVSKKDDHNMNADAVDGNAQLQKKKKSKDGRNRNMTAACDDSMKYARRRN